MATQGTDGQFVQLVIGDDWGAKYYAPHGKELTPSGYAKSSRGLRLRKDQRVRIRWKDGTDQIAKLAPKHYTKRINDMGHEYGVSGVLFGFLIEYHGVELWVPLEKVELWVSHEDLKRYRKMDQDG